MFKIRGKLTAALITALVTVFLFSVGAAAPQEDPQEESVTPDPFRVDVDAVNVLITVTDKTTGNFIRNLPRSAFRIFEDGEEQEITNFTQQTNMPLTIALCIDTSSSVKMKLEFEKEAALDFLYTIIQPRDKALLAEFDTGVTLLHDFTTNPNDLATEINRLKAGGGTSLYDCLYIVSEQKLLYEDGRRTMVVLTDGSDLSSKHTSDEALSSVLKAEAAIYAISTTNLGTDQDWQGDNVLKNISDLTGGRVFFPYNNGELIKALKEVENELRNQYSLTYIPVNLEKDGTYRKIEIKLDADNETVRYRKGYYASLPSDLRRRFGF
ncbi:MAG: VWA domain-containing protein [Anaerolineales bacterium]|nr:VWA domain-containing protein [Anaerolineales bacterium]